MKPNRPKPAVSEGNAPQATVRASNTADNPRYLVPHLVIYRGRVRRVYGVERAKHQGHRHFILCYWRRSAVPDGASTGGFGPRGQMDKMAVYVRSDHCKAVKIR